jgi:hypothetical protein
MLSVVQVLEQLPESLAIAVLAASSGDLRHHLDILPASLHCLAIEAAFPSIRRHQSLKLAIKSTPKVEFYDAFAMTCTARESPLVVDPSTACAVLCAAITASSALKGLDLQNISVGNGRLLQLISAACMCALDVTLSFSDALVQHVSEHSALAQIGEALACNTAFISLFLTFQNGYRQCFHLDRVLEALTGLQSLSLAGTYEYRHEAKASVPAPSCIVNLLGLTSLCIGPHFHVVDLPQVVCRMTHLRALHLWGEREPQLKELPSLSLLTALQTLELQGFSKLEVLPPLATLTSLQTLHLSDCAMLRYIPPLATLSDLRTFKLCQCSQLWELPSLNSLRALQTLELIHCQFQRMPSLDTLTALQNLKVCGCLLLLELPLLDSLTALQTLELMNYRGQPMPSLDALTAIQTLHLIDCDLQPMPSLGNLIALQTLIVSFCSVLLKLPLLDSLISLQTLDLCVCARLHSIPPLDKLGALRTIRLRDLPQLLKLPSLVNLTALETLELSLMWQLQQLPPLGTLTALRTLKLRRCEQLEELPPLDSLTALQELTLRHCGPQQVTSLASLRGLQMIDLGECCMQSIPPLDIQTELQKQVVLLSAASRAPNLAQFHSSADF